MKDFAELLSAIGSLLWPVIVAATLWNFHKQIGSILHEIAGRIALLKRWKGFGQEVEMDRELISLQASTIAAVAEVSALPGPATTTTAPRLANNAVADKILEEARTSPKLALITLAQEIEREVRTLMAVTGWGPTRQIRSLHQGLGFLQEIGSLPPVLAGSIKHFYETRNRVVHAGDATDDDALRALDSGMTLLRALQAIPREMNIVEHPNIPIYQDEGLTVPHEGHAVILKTTSSGGTAETFRIYPTTRTHFEKGKRVAWEWNMGRQWGFAWYRDPMDGKGKAAWGSSAEFIGRHLDEP